MHVLMNLHACDTFAGSLRHLERIPWLVALNPQHIGSALGGFHLLANLLCMHNKKHTLQRLPRLTALSPQRKGALDLQPNVLRVHDKKHTCNGCRSWYRSGQSALAR